MVERAANLRRGTIRAVQGGMQAMEQQAASQEQAPGLADRLQERRVSRALAERLPGLAERLRRHGDTIAQVARQAASLAERVADISRRRRAARRGEPDYWQSVAKGASQAADPAEVKSQTRGRRR